MRYSTADPACQTLPKDDHTDFFVRNQVAILAHHSIGLAVANVNGLFEPSGPLDPYEEREQDDAFRASHPQHAGSVAYEEEGDAGLGACPYAPGAPEYHAWMRGFINAKAATLQMVGKYDHPPAFYKELAEPAPAAQAAVVDEVPDEYRVGEATYADEFDWCTETMESHAARRRAAYGLVFPQLFDPQAFVGMQFSFKVPPIGARKRTSPYSLVKIKPLEPQPLVLAFDPRRADIDVDHLMPPARDAYWGVDPSASAGIGVAYASYYTPWNVWKGVRVTTPRERLEARERELDERALKAMERHRRSHRRTNRW